LIVVEVVFKSHKNRIGKVRDKHCQEKSWLPQCNRKVRRILFL